MTSTKQQRFFSNKRLIISFAVIVVLIVFLAALTYFWLPGYAKSQLEIRLSEILQRHVSVASIEIKPHTLELIVHNFQIDDKTNTQEKPGVLLSFKKLHLDLSIESLTRLAPVITAISLVEPKFRLVRESEKQFNISDLLEKFSQPSDEKTADSAGMQFSISNITIQAGHLEFADRVMKTDQQINEINLAIPIIANFKSALTQWIEPHFSAKINGSPFSLDGKLRTFTENQEATLALKFSQLDLTQIDHYIPLPKDIRLLSGFYDSELLLTFIHTPDKTPDITLTGKSTLRQLAIQNRAVEMPYQANLKQLTLDLTTVDLTGRNPSQVKLNIDRIALIPENVKEPAFSLAHLSIDQITINATEHKVALNEITLDRLRTTLHRDASGAIDLIQLFNHAEATEKKSQNRQQNTQSIAQANAHSKLKLAQIPIPARKPSPDGQSKAIKTETAITETTRNGEKEDSNNNASWTTQIKRIKFKAASLRYEDLTLTKTPPMIIDPLDITIDDVDLKGVKPLNLGINARVNERGHIKVNGSLAWSPFVTDLALNLDSVDLVSLQGWMGNKLNALITSGDVSFLGNLKVQQGDTMKVLVNGEAKLYSLNVFDAKNTQDLLRWKKMDLTGLNVTTDPLRIDIKTASFSNFYAHMVLLPSGDLNLVQIVQIDKPMDVEVAPANNKNAVEVKIVTPDIEPTKTYQVKSPDETFIHIGKVLLQQGNINFHDRFIKPNYRANLTGLNGQIGPLYPGKFGVIDIRGSIDKTAPLEIKGKVEPFSSEFFLDLTAKVKDIDLPPFTPYSSKYVGYAIEKGKLSADVQYHVEKGTLTAENKIFLDQFTLGDKVESEEAMSLPLDLALTLLKNRKGEINLHLPLSGSINDPQFNLGTLIFQAFVNLITKAITAPFTLLASALDGGEELSEISFTPGFADINEDAAKRLEALAEILNERTSLELEIAGHVDATEDYEGLKFALLQDKVKAQKLAEQTDKGIASGAITDITLTPEEYSKYLEITYKKETFEKPKNAIGLTKSLPNAEMEQLIVAHTQINDNDLVALAERRANAARNWLVEVGKVSDARIFVVGTHENKEDEQKKGNRVDFSLK